MPVWVYDLLKERHDWKRSSHYMRQRGRAKRMDSNYRGNGGTFRPRIISNPGIASSAPASIDLLSHGSKTTLCATTRLMHRSKQLELFDHFVGAGEQKMRSCDLAELVRVKRVNFPKAVGACATAVCPKLCALALMQPEDSVHRA
jgi:hypothetical protein